MKKIIVLGSAGNSLDIIDIVNQLSWCSCVGILDDAAELHGRSVYGVKVLGGLDTAPEYGDCYFVNGIWGISSHAVRDQIIARTRLSTERFISVIHPTAVVSPSVSIGKGTVIFANVTIGANAVIGNHCAILASSVINHDVVINDYVSIASCAGVAGGVSIGSMSYIGSGAQVRENLTIGEKALVAMGAVVVKNVALNDTVLGCPAKKRETSER